MEPQDVQSPSERWQQVAGLLESALAMPPEQRTPFLDQACPDDPDLRREVAILLNAHDQAGDFLQEIDADQATALIESVGGAATEGQRIGPYQLVRELGRGGMGAVFLARRADEQFEQQVALKLIKRGMDSEAILRRFLHERQILARLHHPNVARLLDGGVSDEDRPYFAMEYVEGVPLTDYCDGHRLDVEARLRLFEKVCRAVQYAHTNLVVHRDLKPSNMLVTEKGELKLLDFGIAKLLGHDETEAGEGTLTEAGLRVMTPEYAAPEQIRGETITTATDVYALGVVLYELLTGHRPYQFERRTPEEVAHVIGEAQPERPSTAVSQSAEVRRGDGTTETITPEGVSRARGTQPERLRRRLSGDLDTVVLKALRKEPERRYASAEAFVEDIRRHLAGLPVTAQKDTLAYRASKFVRRHTVGVAASAALAMLAILAVGFAVAMALQQAKTAQEATKTEQVKDFLVSLFEMSDPDASKGETITAREMLDAGAARIETELADQPEVQAEMMDMMGEVYWKLGLYDPAQPLFERALTLRRTLLGNEHEDVATSLNNLALLLYEKGDYDTAEPLFREALAMRRKLLGQEHPDVAISLNHLALLLQRTGDYDAAEPLYREALAMKRKLLGEEHPSIAIGLNNLALLLRDKGDYDAAVPFLREAVAMWRKVQGEEHTDLATGLQNLASLLRRKGDYAAAEPLYREALVMRRKLLGREHPSVATTLSGLATLLRD
ncbi:MAG: tetratricopeptide repeat protein, partial [Rhodothermales bacterium]